MFPYPSTWIVPTPPPLNILDMAHYYEKFILIFNFVFEALLTWADRRYYWSVLDAGIGSAKMKK